MQKDWKFLYLKDLVLDKSSKIWTHISLYKKIIDKYNFLINFKNITIIWLIFPIEKKSNI
jgi:hypothetical protein